MENSQTLISALLDAWNAHDTERLKTFFDPQYEGVDVANPGLQRGVTEAQQRIETYLRAFPDLNFTLDDTVLQGAQVVLMWTAHGTHRGVFMHIPPTGRRVVVRGISVLTMKDDKILRGYYMWDVAGLLRAIGLLPEL